MELDLKDYLRILRKRLWLLIAVVVVGCTSTGIISYFFIDPIYESSTKLIVNKRSDLADQLDLNSVNLNLRLVDTYKEIIKTTAIMDKVAAEHPQFGLTPEQLIRKIQISSVNNTQVMTLSVRDPDYERTIEIVNAVASVFVREIPNIMTVDNVFILNVAKPVVNPTPVHPNPELNLAISFVVSLMVGVGLAFLLEYLDDTVKTEQDVLTLLELPTLALIPKARPVDLETSTAYDAKRAGDVSHVSSHHS